jgi:hypothetical protein
MQKEFQVGRRERCWPGTQNIKSQTTAVTEQDGKPRSEDRNLGSRDHGVQAAVGGLWLLMRSSPTAFGNQTISKNHRQQISFPARGDSRLCAPTSQQVCPYRVQSSCERTGCFMFRLNITATLALNRFGFRLSIFL